MGRIWPSITVYDTIGGWRYGYARVSTRSQTDDSQLDALRAAGCQRIWTDTTSGRRARRPEWNKCLDYLRVGDELVITRLSRMARSVRHLTEVAALLTERNVDLVVLKQGIDSTTPAGRFPFHVIGAMDEMLADIISEGTREGLDAARARGRTGGRKPKLTDRQVTVARRMYEEKRPDNKRKYTVDEIAETFHVSRKTIYRHLGPTTPA
jgi:DNA invertase Pin-like site-specific DNA recombinase